MTSTVAPASAANEDGGMGTQTSSQISTWNWNSGSCSIWKTSSDPNGTVCPSRRVSVAAAQSAALNWRAS
ncbi:hypothetical protein FQZ97_661390 [compost metagenome]